MKLEILLARVDEIDRAIVSTNAQLNALNGHKAETNHWIKQLEAEVAEAQVDETLVEPLAEPVVE